ncbi:hypothetical protein SVAN01_03629 [Stagonosporopsis vannaccii]|nr:hypothetical protein SVAN01_03629 [Stagonosporopsis vannaccii]
MGIPYSREINAAFSQVTPLVAAGYKVLQTTKNISIILAVIQVLTVILLGAILVVLGAILVAVNPDLEVERQRLITPWLKSVLHISLYGILKTLFSSAVVLAAVAYAAWRLFLFEQWVEDVEYEANVDADKALEEVEEEEKKGKGGKGKEKKGGKKGKGKEGKGEVDEVLEGEGK